MDYATEMKRGTGNPALAGSFRLMLGMLMLIAGLYILLYYGGKGVGLGLLFLLVSPFVILTDKKEMAFPKI